MSIFGGNTGMTYEDVQRKRKMADQLMRGMSQTPRNVGEGIGAIGKALMIRSANKRADKRMGELRSEADEMFNDVFGGMGGESGGGSYGGSYTAAEPPNPNDAMYPTGDTGPAPEANVDPASGMNMGQPVASPEERELLARTLQAEAGSEGLGGMLAAGAVMDNRRKSGDYGSTYKDVIMAPGQFSAWNSVTGYAGGEQGQNMGFKPNADAYAAADKILSGQYEDPTGGATHYYNPSISSPSWGGGDDWRRIGNHVFGSTTAPGSGGSAGVRGSGGGSFQSGPGTRVAQNSGGVSPQDGMSTMKIARALSNPLIQQDPGKVAILNALLQKQLAPPPGMTPYQQAQIDLQNRKFEADQSGGADSDLPSSVIELQWRAREAGLEPGTDEYESFVLNGGGEPAAYRSLSMQAKAAGYEPGTPEFQRFMADRGAYEKRVGTNRGEADTGAAAAYAGTAGDLAAKTDMAGAAAQAAAEGAARGKIEGEAAAQADVDAPAVIAEADTTISLIDDVINDPNLASVTGKFQGRMNPEGMSGLLMSQDGVNLVTKIEQLQGKAFMQAFESLKGGGQITEREGQAAQNAIARLKRVQDEKAFTVALNELKAIAENGRRRAMGENVPEYSPSQNVAPPANAPAGVPPNPSPKLSDAQWAEAYGKMTPEQRAAFQ